MADDIAASRAPFGAETNLIDVPHSTTYLSDYADSANSYENREVQQRAGLPEPGQEVVFYGFIERRFAGHDTFPDHTQRVTIVVRIAGWSVYSQNQ